MSLPIDLFPVATDSGTPLAYGVLRPLGYRRFSKSAEAELPAEVNYLTLYSEDDFLVSALDQGSCNNCWQLGAHFCAKGMVHHLILPRVFFIEVGAKPVHANHNVMWSAASNTHSAQYT